MRRVPLLLALALAAPLGCADGSEDHAAGPSPGRTPLTSPAPLPLASAPAWEPTIISPTELQARRAAGEEMTVLDVRSLAAYEKEHIAGAKSLPWSDIDKKQATLPRDQPLVLYCA